MSHYDLCQESIRERECVILVKGLLYVAIAVYHIIVQDVNDRYNGKYNLSEDHQAYQKWAALFYKPQTFSLSEVHLLLLLDPDNKGDAIH